MSIQTIAIATECGNVSTHFGSSLEFTILKVQNGKVQNKVISKMTNWKCCEKEKKVIAFGINSLIADKIGKRAYDLFSKAGIEVYTGMQGSVEEVILKITSEDGLPKSYDPCSCEHELEGHCPRKVLKSCHTSKSSCHPPLV